MLFLPLLKLGLLDPARESDDLRRDIFESFGVLLSLYIGGCILRLFGECTLGARAEECGEEGVVVLGIAVAVAVAVAVAGGGGASAPLAENLDLARSPAVFFDGTPGGGGGKDFYVGVRVWMEWGGGGEGWKRVREESGLVVTR